VPGFFSEADVAAVRRAVFTRLAEAGEIAGVTHSRALHEFGDVLLACPSIALTDKVVTVWISFGDIPLDMGPLFVLENSHNHPRVQASIAGFDVARDTDRKAAWPEAPLELARQLPSRLLTRHMRPRDIVAFGMRILHGSFDNVDAQQRIRLSCDVRYQAQSHVR